MYKAVTEWHENETNGNNLANNNLQDVLTRTKTLFSWPEPTVLLCRFNLCVHASLLLNQLGGVTGKRVIVLLCAFIVGGGFLFALLTGGILGISGTIRPAAGPDYTTPLGQANSSRAAIGSSFGVIYASSFPSASAYDATQVIQSALAPAHASSSHGAGASSNSIAGSSNSSLVTGGGEIEFSSNVTISCPYPQKTAAGVVSLAYSVGGYVAYQSTYKDSAYVVVRVPTSSYQSVLGEIEAMGNTTSVTSTSNDVSVQVTDLNATLRSLVTEQGALLRLLNQSTAINTTLAIESQLQGVDQQINEVQTEMLQTKTLVDFATIEATLTESAQSTPLKINLTATPTNGTGPLSVTFNAIVKGGVAPYVVNYNFGDGTSSQGQILIHTYNGAGTYKVVVTVTDQNGTVTMATATIRVSSPTNNYGISDFFGTVASLFVNVVEGIVVVAVVALPLAAVGAIIAIPLKRRGKSQKEVKLG